MKRAIFCAVAMMQILPAGMAWSQVYPTTGPSVPRASLPFGTLAQPTTAPSSYASTPASTPASTQPVQRGVLTTQGGGIELNFKDASIESVLDQLSEVAGFVVVKQTPISGRISLVSKQPLRREEIVPLLNSVLQTNGYAAIQLGRTLKIVTASDAKKSNIPVHTGNDPEAIPETDELVTQVIPIRFADAVQLRQDLSPLIGLNADVTANASSNAIIMTDTSANIRRFVEIVSALDQHLADASDVKVYQLKYAAAASAAKLINDIYGQNQQQSGAQTPQSGSDIRNYFRQRLFSGGGGFGGAPGGGGTGGNTAQARTRSVARVFASSDDRTNTVVVTAPPDVLDSVAKVLSQIDSNPIAEQEVFVYNLKNGDATHMEPVINSLLNPNYSGGNRSSQQSLRSANFGSSGSFSGRSNSGGFGGSSFGGGFGGSSGGGGGFGGSSFSSFGTSGYRGGTSSTGGFGGAALSSTASKTAEDLSGQVMVVANADTNSLLVMTAPKNFDRVRSLLAELDRPVPQVLIKVLVAEVTHNDSSELGAEFSVLNLRSGVNLNSTSQNNGQVGGTDFGLAQKTGGMVVKVFEDNFTATIRALETTGKFDVLSRPYILASDNQASAIIVGSSIPIISNTRITDTGQTLNTIQYQDIGIILNVTPHINPQGLVILDVYPEISALTGDTVSIGNGAAAPVISKRAAQSRVGIQDGQTVVIGGLMQDQKTENVSKIPILGDIPGLGMLFRDTNTTKSKTELLIFMTPHVAAMPESLKGMSKDEMNGTKLTPNAIGPGVFQEHMQGMQRGSATQPVTP